MSEYDTKKKFVLEFIEHLNGCPLCTSLRIKIYSEIVNQFNIVCEVAEDLVVDQDMVLTKNEIDKAATLLSLIAAAKEGMEIHQSGEEEFEFDINIEDLDHIIIVPAVIPEC